MIYVRGHKTDFDRWKDLGNEGWGYDDVLPLFKRSEKVHVRAHDEGYHGRNGFVSATPALLHPKSKGHLTLLSKDPKESLLFFPNYFTDPENHDIKVFIAAIREVQRIIKSPSLRKFDAKLVDIPLPGCGKYGFDTDEYWECSLRTIISSIYHQSSTCKMGPSSDPEAVVNSKLRVHGVKNLRIADVSVVPVTISGHLMATAYMIGEKASDILKEHWGI
nr:unnamed protein product [Callosobruchus analis]